MNGRRRAVAACLLVWAGLFVSPAASAVAPVAVNLKVLGHSDLGGGGGWDDVAGVGTTAVVSSAGDGCPPSTAAIVDVGTPSRPNVVAQLPVPDGLAVAGLDAQQVTTTAFTGDLLAVSVQPCRPGAAGAGVRYYDVTHPSAPSPLGRTDAAGPGGVSLEVRPDGRVLAATVVAGASKSGPAVELDDATDPGRPAVLARWTRPDADAQACPAATADVHLAEGGQRAVVAFDDGGVYELDLADPSRPVTSAYVPGRPGEGASPRAVSVPVGQRTVAVVSEGQGGDGSCPGGAPRGAVRVLTVEPPGAIGDAVDVSDAGTATPGRLAASGELAFVAWHADGLRVLDLGQIRPATVAQFAPADADVVGIGVLGDHLLAVDRGSGLYVLDRPSEGQAESLFKKITYALRFMSIPLIAGAIWVVPRLAMGTSPVPGEARIPAGARVARRRPR